MSSGTFALRRRILLGAALVAAPVTGALASDPQSIAFDDLYAPGGSALGMKFSDRLLSAKGKTVVMRGFMAPPLKPESDFFVLTREPVAVCPFCAADAEWPSDIVVIYLRRVAPPTRFSDPIEVVGQLDVGSFTDVMTGFVSQIRLLDASYRKL